MIFAGLTIEREINFRSHRKTKYEGEASVSAPVGRVPRISRLMALAIRFDQLIRSGEVTDQSELARVGHVSRARLNQIMNLLNLAPDILEAILHLPRVESGREPVTERDLRPIAALMDWGKQRGMWKRYEIASGHHRKHDRIGQK